MCQATHALDAFISRLIPSRWAQAPQRKAGVTGDLQRKSIFMNLPLDVLVMINSHLAAESFLALSSTCKAAHNTFSEEARSKLDALSLSRYCQLMEKSWSADSYLCHKCQKLHRYSTLWRPTSNRRSRLGPPCDRHATDEMCWSKLQLRFYHAQLAMNAHIYGPGRGLHLDRLQTTVIQASSRWGCEYKYQACIIQDELFLKVTHRLRSRVAPYYMDADDGLNAFEAHRICPHLATYDIQGLSWSSMYLERIPGQRRLGRRNVDRDGKKLCPASHRGNCGICLTDYTTNFKCVRAHNENGCYESRIFITVTSYHQLGPCRAPSDWKWKQFANRPGRVYPGVVMRRQREDEHPAGEVMERWRSGKKTRGEKLKGLVMEARDWGLVPSFRFMRGEERYGRAAN